MPYKLVQSISSLASYTAYIANSGPHDIIVIIIYHYLPLLQVIHQ